MITTKKGKSGQTRVNFTASVGFQTISKPKVADAAEYKEVFLQANANIDRDPMWNDTGATTNPGGTDWWDTVVNKTALTQNYALSISGGNDKLVYNLSLGYYRTNSQFDVGYWDKLNARLNTEYTFNKYVKVGFDVAPRVESWDDTSYSFRLLCQWTRQRPYSVPNRNGKTMSSTTTNVRTTTKLGILQVRLHDKMHIHAKWVQS